MHISKLVKQTNKHSSSAVNLIVKGYILMVVIFQFSDMKTLSRIPVFSFLSFLNEHWLPSMTYSKGILLTTMSFITKSTTLSLKNFKTSRELKSGH